MEFFAYLDPGSGSLFIQSIIGIMLAGGVFFRRHISRFVHKMRSVFGKKTAESETKKEETK